MARNFSRCAAALLGAATAAGVLSAADAAPITISLQSGLINITDNGPGDSDPALNRVVNTSNVLNFGIAITVGQSNSPGDPSAGILQVQSLDLQNFNAGPASLSIAVTDTGYTLPGTPGTPMRLDSSVGGTFTQGALGDTVTFQSFADPANAPFGSTVATAPLAFVRSTGNITESFSNANSANFIRGGAYSLTNVTTVTLAPFGQMNISGTTTAVAVPEPQVLGILGLSVVGLIRRARKQS